MTDEPDIVKMLREEEKLGRLQSKVQSAYEELGKPEESPEGIPDKTMGFTEDFKDITEQTQVEERLRESEERYRDLFENINDMIQAVTPDGSFLYVNNAWRKTMGYTQDEIDNLSVFDVIHPDSKKHCMKLFKRIMSGESIKRVEAFFVTKNGKKIAVEGSINCRFRDDKPIATRGIFRDVTDRKKVEEEIKIKDSAIASSISAIAITDIEGKINYVNPAFLKMWRYDDDKDILGKSGVEFWQIKEKATEALQAIQEKGGWFGELTAERKDGTSLDIQISASMIIGRTGSTKGIIASFVDITERKKAEEKIEAEKEKLKTYIESMVDGVVITDAKGVIVQANKSYAEMLDYKSPKELIGKLTFEIIAKKDHSRMMKMFMEAMKKKTHVFKGVELTYLKKDGKEIPIMISVGNVWDKKGKLVYAISVVRDITERKKAEGEIKYLKEYNENILESNPNPMIVIKGNQIEYVNKSFISTFGKTKDDYILRELKEVLPAFEKLLQDQNKMKELEIEGKSFSVSSFVVKKAEEEEEEEEGERIGLTLQDITKRKQAEKDLQERVKELKCLYGVASITERPGITLNELYLEVANLLPLSWRYPEITCARLIIDNMKFETENFRETEWKQSADIKVYGAIAGAVEVFYLEEKPECAEGPFLKEERNLIYTIGERLGRIIERKQTEVKLQESEKKWSSLISNTNDIIMIVDSKGVIQSINKTMPPYTVEDTIGKTVYEYVPKEQHDVMGEALNKVFKTGKINSFKISTDILDVGTLWFNTKIVPIKQDEKVTSAIMISTDVTRRKQATDVMQESAERYHELIEGSHDGYIMTDMNDRITEYNSIFKRMLGYTDEELHDKTYKNITPQEWHSTEAKMVEEQVLKKGFSDTYQKEFICKDGRIIPVELRRYLFKKDNKPMGMWGFVRDITARKQTEDELVKKITDLQRYKNVTVGRELRIIELKEKIRKLEKKLNELK